MVGTDARLPDDIGPALGLLAELDIRKAVAHGYLVEQATFRDSNARFASYEGRIGERCPVQQLDDHCAETTNFHSAREIRIEAGATCLIKMQECLRIPVDVLAKVSTLVRGLPKGVVMDDAYADPGYTGHLLIKLSNVSGATQLLHKGASFVRVEFHKFLQLTLRRPDCIATSHLDQQSTTQY